MKNLLSEKITNWTQVQFFTNPKQTSDRLGSLEFELNKSIRQISYWSIHGQSRKIYGYLSSGPKLRATH